MGCGRSSQRNSSRRLYKNQKVPEIKAKDLSDIAVLAELEESEHQVIKDSHFPGGLRAVPKLKELEENQLMQKRRSRSKESARSGSKDSLGGSSCSPSTNGNNPSFETPMPTMTSVKSTSPGSRSSTKDSIRNLCYEKEKDDLRDVVTTDGERSLDATTPDMDSTPSDPSQYGSAQYGSTVHMPVPYEAKAVAIH